MLPPNLTPDHLTDLLHRAGDLDGARVVRVEVARTQANILSLSVWLQLTYEGTSPGAPATLFLKVPAPDRPKSTVDPREIAFYQGVAVLKPLTVMPRCYEAHTDPAAQHWHLLLEDLADTHVIATDWPLPPTQSECERMIRALARFHAAWWEDDAIGTQVGFRPDADRMQAWATRLQTQFGRFADKAGEWLSVERRRLFERLIAAAPTVLGYGQRRPMTVIHGDAHVWNCFIPKPGVSAQEKWFDWDNSRVDLGASDLAYMMAVHWYPERRRRFESSLLDTYHDALVAAGITGYTRGDLQDDYRLAVLRQMSTPVWQHAAGIPAHVWWNHFERVNAAAEDSGALELL